MTQPSRRSVRCAAALAAITSLSACDKATTGPDAPGFLAITLELAGGIRAAPTSYRVRIEGPTSRTLTLSPGSTQSATGLAPGSYTIAVEGLVGGEIELYGEREGITVASGAETSVNANFLGNFVPGQVGGAPTSVSPGDLVAVSWSPVVRATQYRVEWASNSAFSGAQSQTTSSTALNVVAGAAGQLYLRVRALNRFGAASLPSGATTVTVDPDACIPEQAAVRDLLGDKDGFGRGLSPGDELLPQIFDERSSTDPYFTDINPAFLDSFPPPPGAKEISITFEHGYTPPNGTVIGAELRFLTLGIQDGDNQVFQSDIDLLLFVDGTEVPGAFDDVDQFFNNGTAFVSLVGPVAITLPSTVFGQLVDGRATLRIITRQLGASSGISSWAVDYSELSICVQ